MSQYVAGGSWHAVSAGKQAPAADDIGSLLVRLEYTISERPPGHADG